MSSPDRPRIGLVLSAGGLRGAAHLGVMRQLLAHDIPLDVIVGASVGAVIAAYYAAVGLTVDELIRDARRFRGRHLLAHSLAVRAWTPLAPLLRLWSGSIPDRLAQLQGGRFDRLHHGVGGIGVVCHDLTHDRPRYLSTASHGGVELFEAVATSASIPKMFRPRPVTYEGAVCHFTDGGLSDPLPVGFAGQPGLDATHLIVSDCRQHPPSLGESDPVRGHASAIYLRPRLDRTTTLRSPQGTLLEAVEAGEASVTSDVIAKIQRWTATPDRHPLPGRSPHESS